MFNGTESYEWTKSSEKKIKTKNKINRVVVCRGAGLCECARWRAESYLGNTKPRKLQTNNLQNAGGLLRLWRQHCYRITALYMQPAERRYGSCSLGHATGTQTFLVIKRTLIDPAVETMTPGVSTIL